METFEKAEKGVTDGQQNDITSIKSQVAKMETALTAATAEIKSTKSSLADTVKMINSNIETTTKADKVQDSLIT